MKIKRTLAALLIGLIIITSTGGTYASAAPAKSDTQSVSDDSKNDTFNWPKGPSSSKLSCDSAIVMEVSTGSILYKKNIHKKHYPASITKILTALLAAENSSLSETVNFSETAVYGIEQGSSTIYSEVGEKLSMEQCLYAIALESANEVCLGVAEHIAGSISKFVDMMNARVKELGLKDTHFNNPNGLPDPKHYTSAYDMAVIARTAARNSTFRKVFNTRTYVCAKTNKHKVTRVWNNHHQMINGYKFPQYEYKYCTGGKTGFTQVAKNTLVTFAEKDGMQLVCVVMKAGNPLTGEPNEYTDTISLLNFGFEKYKKYPLNESDTNINSNLFNNYDNFFNSEKSPIHLASESAVVLPKGVKPTDVTQKIKYNNDVSIKDGENIIGQVTYQFAGKTVGSTDIIYDKSETTHLDEASRDIINNEIQEIETKNEKLSGKFRFLSKFANAISTAFSSIADFIISNLIIIVIAIAVIILIIFIIIRRLPSDDKIGTGGYRTRRGRRKHARIQRERRRELSKNNNKRRNHSKHYNKNKNVKEKNNFSRGRRSRRRHKKTKESFGKNYFNF